MIYSNHASRGAALPAVIAVIVALILVGGGYYYLVQSPKGEMACSAEAKLCPDGSSLGRSGPNCEFAACPEGEGIVVSDVEEFLEHEAAMGKNKPIVFEGTVLAGSKSPLIDYNKADYDKAIASDKLVVLYFYADWCPLCRAEFPKMQQAFGELSTDKVVGFRVNYKDNFTDADETALARQFGVGYQHTKVLLKGGKQVLKAPDSWDKARYISEISKAIQ